MGNIEYYIARKLKTHKDTLQIIEPILLDVKELFDISKEQYYNLLVAVTEAVNNAVFHGNKCDPDKDILFSIEVKNNIIEIKVEDEGCGFDSDNLADPRETENLLKEGGRGVFLIKSLMDEVFYEVSDKGTKLTMRCKVGD
jgi:serine/threonine-protein kinase RsbW